MRVLQTVHLSDFQKKVMVIVKSAQTPQIAFEEMQKQPADERNNIIGARDTLQKIGLLAVEENMIEVTPQGEQVMKDEYLIDEMGELTEEARRFIDDASGNQEADMQQQAQDPLAGAQDAPPEEENPFESLQLFKLIDDQSKFFKN